MPFLNFDLSGVRQSLLCHNHVVTSNHMGSIYTTYLTLENYASAISVANTGSIRWPGGTLAERQYQKYSLTNPDIFDVKLGADRGLSDVLHYAIDNELSFSMVLPTHRYMEDVGKGIADVQYFVARLVAGDFGLIPADFTLEIGNETSHYGWSNGKFTPGVGSYGHIANEFLSAINSIINNPELNTNGLNVKVAVQMSTTVGGQSSIFSQISGENLRSVDGFIRHSGLILNADNFDVSLENAKVAAVSNWWNKAWGGEAPALQILDTAWAVGPADPIPANAPSYDTGVRHAGAVVETFSKLIAASSDYAAIWGVQNNPSSMFYHSGATITYGGHAFRMMAESLVGTTLVPGKLSAAGGWVDSDPNWDSIVYADNEKAVVFVSAGDIAEGGVEIFINLQGFGEIQYAWAEVISFSSPVNPLQAVITSANYPGGPVISRMPVTTVDSILKINLMSDYEVIRIIAVRAAEPEQLLHILGTASADDLVGGSLSDILEGRAGSDTLDGGAGGDRLFGGAGNDVFVVNNTGDMVFESSTSTSRIDAGGVDIVRSSVTFSLNAHTGVHFVENLVLTGTASIDGTGNALANQLTGNAGNNTFYGGAGNDKQSGWDGNDSLFGDAGNDALSGNNGDDQLFGGAGNDTLLGGAGINNLFGGTGNDTFIVDATGDKVFESRTSTNRLGEGGFDTVLSSVTFDLDAHAGVRFVENLALSGTASIDGTGNALANRLTGNANHNVLDGGAGNDQLSGWNGNDTLFGGSGKDNLFGGAGNDILYGSSGTDWLIGGEGMDIFVFDTALNRSNVDRINDFNAVQDTIHLDNDVFVGLTIGTLDPSAFAINSRGIATDAFDRVVYEMVTGRVFFDPDGNGIGAHVHFATLAPNVTLTNADFFVV